MELLKSDNDYEKPTQTSALLIKYCKHFSRYWEWDKDIHCHYFYSNCIAGPSWYKRQN